MSASAPAGTAAAAAAAAGALALPLSTADRLALFMQRHTLNDASVAQQLAWPLERLREYLETRKQRVAPLDRADNAVEHLLERYQVSSARQVVAKAPLKPLAPVRGTGRRTCAPTQFPRHASDISTIISTEPSSAASTAPQTQSHGSPAHRKRKRRVESKRLTADVDAPARVKPSSDTMCPVRIDLDVNGTRFQDTLLLNAASSMALSPEAMAEQIARDERFCENVRDAIAESIRRQLTTFSSFISADERVPESLHPIYIDLVIDGFALRDQFEWDINRDFASAQAFASSLCADLELPVPFESAIVFSIWEQVTAYRRAVFAHPWIANDPTKRKLATRTATAPSGYIDVLPPLADADDVERDADAAKLWQPALSELSKEERQFITSRLATLRRPTSVKRPPPPSSSSSSAHHHHQSHHPAHHAPNGHAHKRAVPKKESRMPRPLNAFIMYCQVQKDAVSRSKPRRSASETRKIMGDMWRRMTDEDKEQYAQLAEVENEKRRREHIFELRDRAIAEWEEDEARRRGLLGASALDTTTEHTRGVLLAHYMNERHEVDQHREALALDDNDDGLEQDDADGHGAEQDGA